MKWFMLQDDIERIEALELEAARRGDTVELEALSTPRPNIRRGVARIDINGTMFKGRRPLLEMLGIPHATYPAIIEQIQAAGKAGAKQIDIHADSPGGHVSGLFEAMTAIKETSAHTRVIAEGTLASAMYILASQANEIMARNEAVEVGSVGVAMPVSEDKYITNSDSPKKHPDLATDEGKAAATEPLDDIFQVYAERVADGRGTSVDAVKKDYGQGSIMSARTALSKNMIDGIMSNQPAKPAATIGATMDAKTLKEEHRATYDAVFDAGKDAGAQAERKRASAHLIAAEGGDIEAAHEAIKNGDGYDDLVKAKHDAFARKQNLLAARVADNPPDVDARGESPLVDGFSKEKSAIEAECDGFEWEEA